MDFEIIYDKIYIILVVYSKKELGGIYMSPAAVELNNLLESLEVEDYNSAIKYIEYLSETRKKANAEKSKNALSEINKLFENDKGWETEEEMLTDMASFRRERIKN